MKLLEYSRQPTPQEIRFGYGGSRIYTRLPIEVCLHKDKKPKKRLKLQGASWSYVGPV